MWIDESPMNLCEILGLQPKGVNAYRSRPDKRPAFAGMTRACGNDGSFQGLKVASTKVRNANR